MDVRGDGDEEDDANERATPQRTRADKGKTRALDDYVPPIVELIMRAGYDPTWCAKEVAELPASKARLALIGALCVAQALVALPNMRHPQSAAAVDLLALTSFFVGTHAVVTPEERQSMAADIAPVVNRVMNMLCDWTAPATATAPLPHKPSPMRIEPTSVHSSPSYAPRQLFAPSALASVTSADDNEEEEINYFGTWSSQVEHDAFCEVCNLYYNADTTSDTPVVLRQVGPPNAERGICQLCAADISADKYAPSTHRHLCIRCNLYYSDDTDVDTSFEDRISGVAEHRGICPVCATSSSQEPTPITTSDPARVPVACETCGRTAYYTFLPGDITNPHALCSDCTQRTRA